MATNPQSYAGHTRWHPLFHFFLVPVMIINLIWSIVLCYQSPSWTQCWWVVVSLGLIVMMSLVRTNSLKVQDRLIRLEEQLRCQRVLPAELAQRASGLRVGQYIALRFASDEELETLVTEVVEGRLTKPAEIKQAIKNWRADYFRV
ncbi:MAG: hypothetical protein H7Z16_15365 [Pyrinomonadaceae bacterium]|nr:hypothetical protein [Pyrinomonadaceae bacterium]